MSKIKKAMYETAKGLHKSGGLSVTTMREVEALCLPPVKEYTARQIKQIRIKNKTSHAVFAIYLNTSPSTIQKWESGQKKPNGPSLKLLNLVDKKGLDVLRV
jgi:putative transcriptional regulator